MKPYYRLLGMVRALILVHVTCHMPPIPNHDISLMRDGDIASLRIFIQIIVCIYPRDMWYDVQTKTKDYPYPLLST